MRYHEIIKENSTDSIVQSILDLLTPLAAQGVTYITVNQLINKIKSIPSGLLVDREMIMTILDPNRFPLVKSIEGDKIFLLKRSGADRSVTDQQVDDEQAKISDTAQNQAIKNITK